MTGRDLEDKLHYLGMARGIRKLALKEKLANAEKLAEMTEIEVCDLIAKKVRSSIFGKRRTGIDGKREVQRISERNKSYW